MYDVSVFGDGLIDFIPSQNSSEEHPLFECQIGGTAANVAAGSACLGLNTLMTCKVGGDFFGQYIVHGLQKVGVDVSGIIVDDTYATTMTFVTLTGGERSFSFLRKNTADINIQPAEIDLDTVLNTKILYMTGMGFTDEPIRSVSTSLLKEAYKRGILTSIDINWRAPLWKSKSDFVATITGIIPYCRFYKSSEDEIALLTGEKSLDAATEKIRRKGPSLVLVSCGHKGAYYRFNDMTGMLNTYDVKKVDTTGAGDCFMSAMFYQLCQLKDMKDLAALDLPSCIDFCNAAGALSITCRGGVSSMPSVKGIQTCQRTEKKLEIS